MGASGQPNNQIQNSLVRITSTESEPDYRAPWNSGMIGRGVGAGFVIAGQRILTNAHVVSNSRYLTVEREGDPNKYPATVQFVAHDCDLAVVRVDNTTFWKNMKPLEFGGIPSLESTVSAYGYPIGGERMSVTTGIVSRTDFNLYTHSAIDSHLAIQISAQINPGNSGGPVMQNSKVVGVAFQGYSGDVAQGVAYMIPTPVIRRFLKDIEDGHYDRYVDLGITYTKLQNPPSVTISVCRTMIAECSWTQLFRPVPAEKCSNQAMSSCPSMPIRSQVMLLSNTRAKECRCRKWSNENSKVTRLGSRSCAKSSHSVWKSISAQSGLTSCRAIVMTFARVIFSMVDCSSSQCPSI